MAKEFRQPEELTTERLVMRKSVDERDLDRYLTDLKKTDEFYFQFGMERSDELIGNISLEFEQVIYFTVFLKDTNIMVGYVGITGRDFMRRMGLSANTFYRRVREYEAEHGIAEPTSA